MKQKSSKMSCNVCLLPLPVQFHELARRVQDSGITFIIEPHLRFEGAWRNKVAAAAFRIDKWISMPSRLWCMMPCICDCSNLHVRHACIFCDGVVWAC